MEWNPGELAGRPKPTTTQTGHDDDEDDADGDCDDDDDDDDDDDERGNLYTIKAQGLRLKHQGSRIRG